MNPLLGSFLYTAALFGLLALFVVLIFLGVVLWGVPGGILGLVLGMFFIMWAACYGVSI